MLCPRCAQNVPNGAASCPKCGAPLLTVPSDLTLNASPQGGARPGHPEVDDIAGTLVWQKGNPASPSPLAGPPGVATLSNLGGPGRVVPGQHGAQQQAPYSQQQAGGQLSAPQAGYAPPQAMPASMVATRLAGTQAGNLGANMMGATAVGMPPGFEEEVRAQRAPSANTLVGMPKDPSQPQPSSANSPLRQPPTANRTLVGVAMPGSGFDAQGNPIRSSPQGGVAQRPAGASDPPPAQPPSATAGGGSSTLPARVLGGANSGPKSGPVPPARASAPRNAAPVASPQQQRRPHEFGGTSTPALAQRKMPGMNDPPVSKRKGGLERRLVVAAPGKKGQGNRVGIFAIAGGVAALIAVLLVVLWPGRGAVLAKPRVDSDGRDGLDIECRGCPDATAVRIGSITATIVGQHAFVPISLPLGESKLEVAIDRPGDGKDEVVNVKVHMPYRVTTDLGTLRGERPSIQVVVEAQDGTQVMLDGKSIPLVAGRAIDMLDVTEICTGESEEARTLSRKIPYIVTPPGGSPEQGTLHISVPITTLRITAPGAAIVTEKESFVLAGRTAKGVELFAGPHAIPLRADGSFAHVMNVSAVGATQISVRAQAQGMAPRIVKVDVRRVESLDAAAREFAAKSPMSFADLSVDPKSKVGRYAMISGFVLGSKSADQLTVLRLRGYGGPACPALPAGTKAESLGDPGPCGVEIAVGAQVPYVPGDLITGCGRFAGTTGEAGAEVPQLRADFIVQGIQ